MSDVVRRGPYPELTWPAVLVGWLLGAIIAVSIGYAALILGFSIEGSELAAILGWGILRGLMRRTSIVENNINQSIASAVNAASSGMMFSVPALFILSDEYKNVTEFNRVLMVLCCVTGAVIGLSFVIPLRKQMIDFNRLAYPGGIATAAILKSPGAGMRKAMLMLGAAAVSGLAYFWVLRYSGDASTFVDHEEFHLGDALGWPSYLNVTFYLSVMTVGVGFLSGRGGLWFGAGGFLCYWFLAPLLAKFAAAPEMVALIHGEEGGPGPLRGTLFRPAGIGMLIGAAIGSIVFAAPMIKSAIQSMQQAAKDTGEGDRRGLRDEMPIRLLYVGVLAGSAVLIGLCLFTVPDMTLGTAVMMAVLGVLWVWVAGVIVSECVGRTNWSPLSGMTLIAVTILTVMASGLGDTQQIVASVMMGAAICVAISQASDMMLDLKAGYLVGARPKMQAYGQYLGTWLGPIIVIALILLLHEAYGLGSEKLPAPQGQALASMIHGIVGGDVPTYRYGAGAGLGLLFALSGFGGIGVLVGLGFYMPFAIVLTYTIGNFVRMGADRWKGRSWVENTGIPIAAGLIVGEALVGVGNAMVKVFGAGGGA
ncbi:MAG: OPT family oligopeptide transporter [Planctomycetota bacterium JB042]